MKNNGNDKSIVQHNVPLDITWHSWHIPELSEGLYSHEVDRHDLALCSSLVRRKLDEVRSIPQKKSLQVMFIEWLYSTVRRNIRRGRTYELIEVLRSGQADCLGYARLFVVLGTSFGMELGVVEVLIDNAGRYVPHYVNLAHLADSSLRFIDAWYGSTNIRHRRIAALINGTVSDVNIEDVDDANKIEGLPADCIRALGLYIEGNRFLERDDIDAAIACYDKAITLYPSNSRIWFNRAIAYERKGRNRDAQRDYAVAFKDEAGIIRVLATVEALEELIRLDEKHINEREQEIYLHYKGFKTGKPTPFETIGKTYAVTPDEIGRIISRIENTG
jgi:regulator of sirC expression with transglutaminase-like and TPR domain